MYIDNKSTFKTVGQLTKYLINRMIEENLSPVKAMNKYRYTVEDNINLFRLSHDEAQYLMDNVYTSCVTKEEIKYQVLYDFCQYKLRDYYNYRSINSFKSYLIG